MVATLTNPNLPALSPEDHALLLRYFHHHERLDSLAAELAAAPLSSPSLPLPDGGARAGGSDSPDTSPNPAHHSPLPSHHSLLTLLTWTASPAIAPYIALYRAHIAHLDRREAIEALKSVIRASDDPIEKRRAASSMLRLLQDRRSGGAQAPGASPDTPRSTRLTQSSAPSPQSSIDPDDSEIDQFDDESDDQPADESSPPISPSPDPPVPPPAPYTPSHPKNHFPAVPIIEASADKPGQVDSVPHSPLPDPCRTPADVALLILKAIQTPDDPSGGAGPKILFNLQGHLNDRSLKHFSEYKNNYLANVVRGSWNFKSFEFTKIKTQPAFALYIARLTHADGRTTTLNIELEKVPAGTLKNCWVTHHLFVGDFHHDSG